MTTVITVGDPHFKTDNITEVNLFIDALIKLVSEVKPDFCVVLGDVLDTHERIHTIPLNKAYELITKLKQLVPTFVLIGNHDMISNAQFLNDNHWMNGMKEWENVTIVDRVVTHRDKHGQLYVFCPYVPNGRFEEALQTCSTEDWKHSTCIFAHQEIVGCKMGAIVSVEGDPWDESKPFLISGHIHSKQTLPNVYYCGSALQHAFGESDKNIIAVVTFMDGKHSIREVDLGLPRKKIIYTDMDSIEKLETKQTPDKIKITVSGNYEEFKAFKKTKKYKELLDQGNKVVFKPKKIEKQEEITMSDGGTFKGILYRLVSEMKNKHVQQAYESLLRASSSID